MAIEDWLPRNNDTRSVVAAIDNEFVKNAAAIRILPSELPVTRSYERIRPQ